MSSRSLLVRLGLPAVLGAIALSLAAPAAGPEEPRFTADNELIRPEGYREWVFVGSSTGMSYSENQPKRDNPSFNNIYIKPSAYRQFKQTGEFPDGTILVMEKVSAGSNASINRQGRFQDEFLGIEATVKDSSRFEEKWAYFNFIAPDGSSFATTKAFPKERCWSCHNEHAASDNVFTQFYPVLRHGD